MSFGPPTLPSSPCSPFLSPSISTYDEGAEHAGGLGCVQGVCDMPGGMLIRFWAMVCVPEKGRAGGIAIMSLMMWQAV
jgi:hypothetical protein